MHDTLTVNGMPVGVVAAPQTPYPHWWTARDVAVYRRVSVSTIHNMVTRAKRLRLEGKPGGIPFSQPDGHGHVRFKPELVIAYFEQSE